MFKDVGATEGGHCGLPSKDCIGMLFRNNDVRRVWEFSAGDVPEPLPETKPELKVQGFRI